MTTGKIVLVVGAIILAVCLLVLIFVGGIVGFAFYSVGKSDAATRAKDFLKASPVLKQDIGDVKDFGSFVTGSINVQNDDGAAMLNLKVIGEKKVVNATVSLAYNGRTWRVSSASYVNDRGQTVNLLDPYESNLMFHAIHDSLINWEGSDSVPFAVADGQDSTPITTACALSPGHPLPRTVLNHTRSMSFRRTSSHAG